MILDWKPETDPGLIPGYTAQRCFSVNMTENWKLLLADIGAKPRCRNHTYVFRLLQIINTNTTDNPCANSKVLFEKEFKAKDDVSAEDKAVMSTKSYAKQQLANVNKFKKAVFRCLNRRVPNWTQGPGANTWALRFDRDTSILLHEIHARIPTRRTFQAELATNDNGVQSLDILPYTNLTEIRSNEPIEKAQQEAVRSLGTQITTLWRHHRILYIASCELLAGLCTIARPADDAQNQRNGG